MAKTTSVPLTYDQVLARAEQIMADSGIRQFCHNICKGFCCYDHYYGDCRKSKNACHLNEDRRLACSLYSCGPLLKLIKHILMPGDASWDVRVTMFMFMWGCCTHQITEAGMKQNPHFFPVPQKVRKKFSLKQSDANRAFPRDKEIRKVKLVMEKVYALALIMPPSRNGESRFGVDVLEDINDAFEKEQKSRERWKKKKRIYEIDNPPDVKEIIAKIFSLANK